MKTLTERRRRWGSRTRGSRISPSGLSDSGLNFRVTQPSEFEELKDRLLREQLSAETRPELFPALRRAANDAAAIAWAAPFPVLVLPELFREKVAAAQRYAARQSTVRRRTQRASTLIGEGKAA